MDAQFCYELLKIMNDDYKNTPLKDRILKMGNIFQMNYQTLEMAKAKAMRKDIRDELPPSTAGRFPLHHRRVSDDNV